MRATMRRMGVLLSAVAVRSDDADEVVDVFLSLLRGVGHRVQPVPGPHDDAGRYDVLCTASSGWVTLAPHYVVPAEKLGAELTHRLGTVASAVGIYEDVFWTHHLVDRGEVRDQYANLPGYFGPADYVHDHEGDPELVAASVGVPHADVAPYFQQISVNRARSRWRRPPRAHDSDEHHLLDGWVVLDLWRRFGITYPDGRARSTIRVPLSDEANDALTEWLRGY